MGSVNDTISNINSTLRTLLLTALCGGAGIGGYKVYEIYNEPLEKLAAKEAELAKSTETLKRVQDDLLQRQNEIESLETTVAEKSAQIDRLEVAKRLLKVRHRLARVKVIDQREIPAADAANPSDGEPNKTGRPHIATKVEFVEVGEQGESIGEPKQLEIVGDMMYVDYLHVTFDDKFVEQSDIDRSTSLALFQRVFGEYQEPAEGFRIDTVGTRPTAYGRGTRMSEFEQKIWDDFWLIANDPQRATELGIHSAQGAAVAMRLEKDKTYEIELRSTGEMTFRPLGESASPVAPAAAEPGATK